VPLEPGTARLAKGADHGGDQRLDQPVIPARTRSAITSGSALTLGGCRADTGLLYLPGDGGAVAYCAVADRLADQTMTALSEGEQILGRLGAIVLARWWPGPGPVPVRAGWLPGSGGR
jgi:hypothetical protein